MNPQDLQPILPILITAGWGCVLLLIDAFLPARRRAATPLLAGLGLGAALLAVVAGFGVPGAWAAAVMDINTRALLMFLRFRQGRWKRIKV